MMQKKQNHLSMQPIFLIIGFLFTWLILGFENLNIFNSNWTLYDDAITDYLSWIYYKNDVWRFPVIGENPNYGLNNGSTIAFSAIIPFLALIFKSLKYFIPNSFNYFGFWFFLCFYLQSYISFLLIKKLTNDHYYSLVGSIFFCLSPIFFNQIGLHFSLSGQWIIILSFYFYCNESLDKKFSYNIFLICFSALVHFSFTVMLSIIYGVLAFFNFIDKKNFSFHLKKIIILITILFPLMYTLGFFEIPIQDTLGPGYGFYKLNLLAPIDPSGGNLNGVTLWSRFIPDIPNATGGELEGFSYFGIGQILLLICGIFLFLKKKREIDIKKYFPYILLIIFLLLLSVTHKVDIGNYNLITLELNKYFLAALSWVRSSGRFFWPIYYFLLFFSIYMVSKNLYKKKRILLLSVLLLIQITDISEGLKNYAFGKSFNKKEYKLNDPIWKNLNDDYEIISSTYIKNQSNDFFKIIDYLTTNIMKTEIAYLSRFDRKELVDARYNNYSNFYDNKLDSKKFYIINNFGHLNHLKFLTKNTRHALLERDSIWLLLPNKADIMTEKDLANLAFIQTQKIKLDERIDFNLNSLNESSSLFGLGWTYDFSTKGIWTDGNNSTILLNAENLSDDLYFVEIDVEPNLLRPNQLIEVKIFGNGITTQKISFDNLNDAKINKIKIKFNKQNLIEKKYLLMNLDISGAIPAWEVKKSPDFRKLGLKINSLIITK